MTTYEEADWFAVKTIVHYLFMPVDIASSLAPQLTLTQRQRVRALFGDGIIKFLEKIDRFIAGFTILEGLSDSARVPLNLPKEEIDISHLPQLRDDLRLGIDKHVDYHIQRFIKGDSRNIQSKISNYAIDNGGFGGIMALLRTGSIRGNGAEQMKKWLSYAVPQIRELSHDKTTNVGLFTGIAGICSILADLGQNSLALKLIKSIPIDLESKDFSVYSGLSGIGLVQLAFYEITKEEQLLSNAKLIVEIILTRNDVESDEVGLLDGVAGEALFIEQFGYTVNDPIYIKAAYQLMDKMVDSRLLYDQRNWLTVMDSNGQQQRLFADLSNGASGIALVMLEFSRKDRKYLNSKRKKLLDDLVNVNYVSCSECAGLVDGFTGSLVLSNALAAITGDNKQLQYNLQGLNSYLVSNRQHEIFVPNEAGEKCSMDFSAGASGVLLGINDLGTDHWDSWLPLPKRGNLDLFRTSTRKDEKIATTAIDKED